MHVIVMIYHSYDLWFCLGLENRIVQCVRVSDNVPMPLEFCDPLPEGTLLTKSCDTPCPINCQLGDVSPWSPCTADCGSEAYKSRNWSVQIPANENGQQCSPREHLNQVGSFSVLLSHNALIIIC